LQNWTIGKRINVLKKKISIPDCDWNLRLVVRFPLTVKKLYYHNSLYRFTYISLFVFPSACLPSFLPACVCVCGCASPYLSVSLSISLPVSLFVFFLFLCLILFLFLGLFCFSTFQK
jgi:hypothetical protein